MNLVLSFQLGLLLIHKGKKVSDPGGLALASLPTWAATPQVSPQILQQLTASLPGAANPHSTWSWPAEKWQKFTRPVGNLLWT